MKGFIKIAISNNRELFINIDYIISFKEQSANSGTELSVTDNVGKVTIHTTTSTPQEICDMIELARP